MLAHQSGQRIDHVGLADANRHGQQLFMAGMWHQAGTGKRPYVKKTIPPDMSLLRPVSHRQLVLLDLPRDLKAGLRKGFPPPPHPGREAALVAFVGEHASRYGWAKSKAERVRRAMRIMLAIQDTPGAPIRRSDVALLTRIKHSATVVAYVLDDAGLLEDDREPAVVRWFNATVVALPEPMRRELGVWLDVMRNGSTTPPRRRPRNDGTISTQLRWALPTLQQWANPHASLREIGRDDVAAVLPTAGLVRFTTLQGLRSIFRILKAASSSSSTPPPASTSRNRRRKLPSRSTSTSCGQTWTPTHPPPPPWPRCSHSTPCACGNCANCGSPTCTTAGCTSATKSSHSRPRSASG